MDYKGKLYGKIGKKYFDTSHTSDDYDRLTQENIDLKEQLRLHDVGKSFLYKDEKLIENMCLSYRHDFGLLPEFLQTDLRGKCKEWLIALENNK